MDRVVLPVFEFGGRQIRLLLQLVGALEVLLVLFELLLSSCELVQRLEQLLVRIEASPSLVHRG